MIGIFSIQPSIKKVFESYVYSWWPGKRIQRKKTQVEQRYLRKFENLSDYDDWYFLKNF